MITSLKTISSRYVGIHQARTPEILELCGKLIFSHLYENFRERPDSLGNLSLNLLVDELNLAL